VRTTSPSLGEILRRSRVLPVLRSSSPGEARQHVASLAAAGLPAVELTTTTPGWAEALGAAVADHPGLWFGLGTVRDPDDVRRAADLGVRFLVTPWPAPAVRTVADAARVALVEGGLTPGELASGARHGPVKLFPAAAVGPDYLRTIRPVLADADVVPTGGIGLGDVEEWLAAGALAVGIGGDLLRALAADRTGTAERLAALTGAAR